MTTSRLKLKSSELKSMPVKLKRASGYLLKTPLAILRSAGIGLFCERKATSCQRVGEPKARELRFAVLRHLAILTSAIADEKHGLKALWREAMLW